MGDIHLQYGRSGYALRVKDSWDVSVFQKVAMPVESDPYVAVGMALAQPVGCEPLDILARGAESACIVICDITRPVPNGLFLRQLVERLRRGGVEREDVSILVATGLHRPNEGDELKELIGDPWVCENLSIFNHDARDDAAHRDLGKTTRGTPIKINRRFAEADMKIVTGLVEPHFMAGYSGGRKVVAPGIAHHETIRTFHNHWFMSHPNSRNCLLDGNPLHEEQLEIVAALGPVYAVNTVLDEQRRLSFINFGEVLRSHLQAVEYCDRYAKVQVARKFKTVVTSAAGYPLDKTFYQTVKGMVGACEILAEGGTLIIASECSEGLGSPEFQEAQHRLLHLGMGGFLQSLQSKPLAAIDEWQTQMQLRAQVQGKVVLYAPNLTIEQRRATGVEVVDSLEEAVEKSIQQFGDPSIAVIPEGPYLIPQYCESQ